MKVQDESQKHSQSLLEILVAQNNQLIEQNSELIKINYEQSAQINMLLDQLVEDGQDSQVSQTMNLDD